ncbi:MAG: topoisomerase DNA-binding C4 zinc finger domain-containing protein, partial [Candidatus Cloacimonadaceae bacterium]|nr:topoisomerase DNA-binding C4 zinc finger domain-containing protein [Candidatus Cloacimonadaceae bacterium]
VDVKKERSSFTEETDIVCDLCHEGKLVVKRSRNGEFLSCSTFPKCKNIKSLARDKDGKISIKEPVVLKDKCPKCGGELVERSGKFGDFIACASYPKCKYSRAKSSGLPCPDCGKGEIVERRNKKGRKFYSCSTYPECKWITNDKPVQIACPNCGNDFVFEKYSKDEGNYKECPKCKTRMD